MQVENDILKKSAPKFVLVELEDEYYEKMGLAEEELRVPVPMTEEQFEAVKNGGELSLESLVENMMFACGYEEYEEISAAYIYSLNEIVGSNLPDMLLGFGDHNAGKGDFLYAALIFRSMTVIFKYIMENTEKDEGVSETEIEEFKRQLYGLIQTAEYRCAMAVHAEYNRLAEKLKEGNVSEEQEGEILISIKELKKMALDKFETITNENPEFYPAYYPLGYAYWNLGQYIKANLCFEKYIELIDNLPSNEFVSEDEEMFYMNQYEIAKENIDELSGAVEIEHAINAISRGEYSKGMEVLKIYSKQPKYEHWWPVHFYLGVAYEEIGFTDAAILEYKKVTRLNASHIKTVEGLIRCYGVLGDSEKVEKYNRKLGILQKQGDIE